MSLILKTDARSLARRVTTHFFQEFVDAPVNGRPSFFRTDSVHQMETSLSHAWSINTKSMGRINIKCQNGLVLPPDQVFYFNGKALHAKSFIKLVLCIFLNESRFTRFI
jgi:hypothetical protein